MRERCPLYPRKRTLKVVGGMSAKCQKVDIGHSEFIPTAHTTVGMLKDIKFQNDVTRPAQGDRKMISVPTRHWTV